MLAVFVCDDSIWATIARYVVLGFALLGIWSALFIVRMMYVEKKRRRG